MSEFFDESGEKNRDLSDTKLEILRKETVVLTPATVRSHLLTENADGYKFAREKKRIIIFPAMNDTHLDYVIADGMENPDDGGFIYPSSSKIHILGYSSSMNIPDVNNPERDNTVRILQAMLPEGVAVVSV